MRERKNIMNRKTSISLLIVLSILSPLFSNIVFSFVDQKGDKTYIVDRTGERWDITQAKSIGFKPEGFQYGIGRNAFTTLDDKDVGDKTDSLSPGLRVIGVSDGSDTQAYSVRKLVRHEIANVTLGSRPIAAGY